MFGLFRFSLIAIILALPARAQLPSWDDPEWYAAPPNPLNLEMVPDMPRGVQSTIGPAGGTFATTGANGDVYALTIPAGALFTDTTIAMIPVAEAQGLPEGAGPFSGVILQPDGLELAKTGWLEITPVTPIPPEKIALWGFYGTGEDARGEINWPNTGDRIVIPLNHFSGAGVSIADRINLQLDRWRQKNVEDRVQSQLSEMMRDAVAERGSTLEAIHFIMAGDGHRVIKHGQDTILRSAAVTCADFQKVSESITRIKKQKELLGVDDPDFIYAISDLQTRGWKACLDEALQKCLSTGDVDVIRSFAASTERSRMMLVGPDDDPSLFELTGAETQDVVSAMERCGRFKLEVLATGQWRDPSGVNGSLSFKVDIPIRLTVTDRNWFIYELKGEAPATDVNVRFSDSECWEIHGYVNSAPMQVNVTLLEFRHEESRGPLRLELSVSAPEILAELSCKGDKMDHRIQAPMSPMLWAVAHQKDRSGEVFKLARFQAKSHPVLWEMEWTGDGAEDGLNASDKTTLKFIHIAQ